VFRSVAGKIKNAADEKKELNDQALIDDSDKKQGFSAEEISRHTPMMQQRIPPMWPHK
jgi:hypothetical protein